MLSQSNFRTLSFSLSQDGIFYHKIFEIGEPSIHQQLSSGRTSSQIIDSFFESGKELINSGHYKDFKIQIWDGKVLFNLTHSGQIQPDDYQLDKFVDESDLEIQRAKFQKLTKAERQVLRHLLNGTEQNSLSEEMHICKYTVRTHLKRIYKKLEVHSKEELLTWLRKYGVHFDLNFEE